MGCVGGCLLALGVQLAQQRHPSADPVLGGHVGVEHHGDDVVGGVSRGGQGAATLAGLVDGGQVAHALRDVLLLHGLQPDLGWGWGGPKRKAQGEGEM